MNRYLGKHDSPESREKYRRVVAEWLATSLPAPAPAGAIPAPSPSVAEVILAFWKHAQQHYRGPDGHALGGAGQHQGSPQAGPAALRHDARARLRPPGPAGGPGADVAAGLMRTTINGRVNRSAGPSSGRPRSR